jgi:2-methylcitrate dehydratase PrpD
MNPLVPADPAAWAAFASSCAVPPAARAQLLLHVADGVLALLAGQGTSEGRALQAFLLRTDPGALGRAALQAAQMRHTEIDDIHRPTAVTPTAIALPAALAFAGQASLDRFLDAVYVGQGIAVHAAAAMGGSALLARGLWPSYLAAPLGAAAAAGRMLGLAPDRMAHAMALALAQTPRAPGRTQGDRPGRWLLFGQAVRAGCLAAAAAQDGVDGDPALLRADALAAMGGPGVDAAPPRLAEAANVLEALSIKPHCGAKQGMAAVHALQRLLAAGVAADSIEQVDVHVPAAYAAMLQREPAQNGRLASIVNVGWQLALAALRPALLDDIQRQPVPADADLLAFAARVRVHADPALDPLYPAQWPARVVVTTGSRRHEALVSDSPGDPAAPLNAADLRAKAARVLGAGHPDRSWVNRALALGTDTSAWPELRERLNRVAGEASAAASGDSGAA